MATEEREKAAAILREALVQQIAAGDQALERHISDQVKQIETVIMMGTQQVDAAFAASEKAILKAETATERRFESVNEFRAQLASQTASFMPREVAEARLGEIVTKLEDVQRRLDTTQGRAAGITGSVGLMIAVSGVVLAIIVIFVNIMLSQ